MFDLSGSSYGTIELKGVIYDGSQNEIRIARNSAFYYGLYFVVGGVRYELVKTTDSEYVYNAKR